MRKNLFKSIVLSIIFLIAGNAVNAQLSYRCAGDNILDGVTFDTGSCYYGPSWVQSSDYTVTWENDELSIHLGGAAMTGEHQGQFRIVADDVIKNLKGGTGEKILVSFDIEVDEKTSVQVQIKDTGDATFAATPDDWDLMSGTHRISHLIPVDSGNHAFGMLYFGFHWVGGVANIRISNISICDEYEIEIGSIVGTGVAIYPCSDAAPNDIDNPTPGDAITTTLDYKVVTIDGKTWTWTKLNGGTYASTENWAIQLRYWDTAKVEYQFGSNQNSDNTQAWSAAFDWSTVTNPAKITFWQNLTTDAFTQTSAITYDYIGSNSADAGDKTAPTLETPVVFNQSSSEVILVLSATDASNNLYYYIEDVDNGLLEVAFLDTVTLALKDSTNYNLKIYAIDFSGNVSEVKSVELLSLAAVYVNEGVANENSFKLDSRSGKLVVEGTATGEPFGDVYVKVSIDGNWITNMVGAAKEWRPTGLDKVNGTPVYVLQIPASEIPGWEEGKILTLDLGYITIPNLLAENWSEWVSPNLNITEGENEGKPILHKIGTGVDIETAIEDVMIAVPSSMFKVYCANGVLSVKGEATPSNMTLYNVAGQKVLEVKNANSANVSNLRRGAYLLRILTNSGAVEVHKIVL